MTWLDYYISSSINHIYWLFMLVAIMIAFYFGIKRRGKKIEDTQQGGGEIDYDALNAAEEALRESASKDWVIVKRLAGAGYNHAALAEIVSELASKGIEATYDTLSSSSADMGPNNYVLKVLKGDEEEALRILESI